MWPSKPLTLKISIRSKRFKTASDESRPRSSLYSGTDLSFIVDDRNIKYSKGVGEGELEFKKYELAERASKFGLDVLAVSDARVKGQIEDEVGDYRILLSGVTRGRLNWGVGF